MSGDSLYACEGFFQSCAKHGWRFLIRFKEGSIPTVQEEYSALKALENNEFKQNNCTYDYVTGIDYKGPPLNYVYYSENSETNFKFLTDLPLTKKNVPLTVLYGRRRWGIENYGFNKQKKHGYFIEHLSARIVKP